MATDTTRSNPVEDIKTNSNFLRGTLQQGLTDTASAGLSEADTQLTKFHGIYQQDDRDVRDQRRKQMLEPDHSFMIRVRMPGGACTAEQWLAVDAIANRWANHSLRLTSRQAFQFHGVLKNDLKTSIQRINSSLLDTLAACGDVNRNVMCTVLPELSAIHRQVFDDASKLSTHLLPQTTAYHEIWLDKKKVVGSTDVEPIYGETYLPRKFKTAFAIPPHNDVDVFAHDLGYIAVVDDGELLGYNISVGGGMGATHGDPKTYPLLAQLLGFCTPDQVNEVAEAIVRIQHEFGDRGNRKHARFKYTVEDHGLDWLRDQLESRLGYPLESVRPVTFSHTGDDYGWKRGEDGLWNLLLFIQNGRILDTGHAPMLTGLREIAKLHNGEFRLTANQNVVIAGVTEQEKDLIVATTREYGLDAHEQLSKARLGAMACVAFPTCSLAMAEAERYLPELLDKIEDSLKQHGLQDQDINIRMSGCPNGCSRPYLAEIGLVGKAPGRYQLYLGAARDGSRLNRLVLENVDEQGILRALDQALIQFKYDRKDTESFGDYAHRIGSDLVKGGM
jgi:sulfite reductase (NADPH) hemoprotein beta-component